MSSDTLLSQCSVPLASKSSCERCALKALCVPVGLTPEEEKTHLSLVIDRHALIAKGFSVCEQGEAFNGLFVVRSGAFKAVRRDDTGREMISAFYLPGEFFGLDALADEQYPVSVMALEDSSICRLSFDALLELMRQIPSLQKHFMALISQNLKDANAQIMHHHTAEERLMLFLKRLSVHFEKRGFSGLEFNLPMSRKDMANYLDLANETISRLFAVLQEKGRVKVEHKTVTLLG